MDDLFTVFRYLATNRNATDKQNPYSIAFSALNDYIETQSEIAFYAKKIRDTGGLTWDEANALTEHILIDSEVGLIKHHGSPSAAAIRFIERYVSLEKIGELIESCQQEQARMQREEDEEKRG